MTWRACGIRSCAAGFCTTGASTNPSCTQSSVISTTFWFVGPCGNTSGSAGTIDAPHIGSLRWQVGSRGCLPTGIYWANGRAAGCWEPYERRRSRTVLRAPGGETPSGDSPQHLRPQRASGSTSDEEPYAIHYEEAQAEGERSEECGGATAGTKISRVQLQGRSGGQARYRAQGPGPLQAPHPRDHATGQKRQHADDNRGVGSVYAGLAQLFRLLRHQKCWSPSPVG